ncbi:MAG: PAS domain S-box protein [Methylobacter sp.]
MNYWNPAAMGLIYLVYGLAFFVLGVVASMLPKQNTTCRFAPHLPLLAAFGILHGITEFIEIQRLNNPAEWLAWLGRLTALASYLPLLEFGRRIWIDISDSIRLPAPWLYGAVVIGVAMPAQWTTAPLAGLTMDTHWFVGAPAALLTGLALLAAQRSQYQAYATRSNTVWLRIVALAFIGYSLLTLALYQSDPHLPAWLPTQADFLVLFGFPIQLLLALCAVVATMGFVSLVRQVDENSQVDATAFDSHEAIVITDANAVILRINKAFTKSTGYTTEEAVGRKISLLKSGRHDKAFYAAMWKSIIHNGTWQGEIWDRRKNGDIYPKWLTITAVKDGAGLVIYYVGTHIDITEQKQAQQKLQDKEQILSESQRIAHIGSWSMEPGADRISWSDEMYRIFGVTQETFGHSRAAFLDLIHPDDRDVMNTWLTDCQAGKEPKELDFRIVLPNDTVRNIRGSSGLQYDELKRPLRMVGSAQDITERKQSERVLNQLKAMIDISVDGFWIVDLLGNVLQVNEGYAKMSGYSIDELTGVNSSQLEAIEGAEQIKTHMAKVVVMGYDRFETRLRHKDGHTIVIEVSATFLPEFQQFCVFCRDITERKLMEDELKASEAKFRSIIEACPVPMVLNDAQSNITFLNQAFVQTFGYSTDDIHTLADWRAKAYPDSDYRQWVNTTWQTAREKADCPPMEVSIRCKNNSIKTVLVTAATIHHDFADVRLVVLYDITQRKQIEAKLNAIFNAAVESIITIDMSANIVSANTAVETIFGYQPEELVGCSINKLIPPSPRGTNDCSSPHTVKFVGQVQEVEGIHKNGSMVPLDLSIAEFSIDNAHYFTYIARDVSLRKYREQQDKEHLDELAHVTRLGLMGEMASGIAHEVNQPLSAISNYTQVSLNLINSEKPDLAKFTEILYKTQQQALRAGQIIHRMREFLKSHAKHRSTADVNALVHEAVGLCISEIKQSNIKLVFELENNLPPVYVDHVQIEQVLINLIRNSVDALQNIAATEQRQLTIHSRLTLNNSIQVRVKDNGPGLNEEQQQKILMPFYTTKTNGMGMGLSISRSLIEAHEGVLHFNSQPEKGTTFYFTLPIQKESDPL